MTACTVQSTVVLWRRFTAVFARSGGASSVKNGSAQRALAEAAGLSLPTIQRMEASDGTIRGNVDSLVKLIAALDAAGVELVSEGAISDGGGRGVRLKR